MASSKPPYDSIVTQKIPANELISEMQRRPEACFFIRGTDDGPSGDWSNATSHAISNVTHYLSDDGPGLKVEFHDGTPNRLIPPGNIIEVQSVASPTSE